MTTHAGHLSRFFLVFVEAFRRLKGCDSAEFIEQELWGRIYSFIEVWNPDRGVDGFFSRIQIKIL